MGLLTTGDVVRGPSNRFYCRKRGRAREGKKYSLHPLEKHQVLFFWGTRAGSLTVKSINTATGFSENCRSCFPAVHGEQYISDFLQGGTEGEYLLPCWGESQAWVLIDRRSAALVLLCKKTPAGSLTPVGTSRQWPAELRRGCWVNKLSLSRLFS